MAVKKITWKTLMTQISAKTELELFVNDITSLDDALNENLGYSAKPLKLLMESVTEDIMTPSNQGLWKDLPIWVSSYRENDKRFVYLVSSKLREYIGFYKKILEDEGVQRRLVYSKEYSNLGSASSTERGTDSVTPQNSNLYDSEHPESDSLFDEAIANYASSINKNKANSSTSSSGDSVTNVTGTTWEEQKKNLQMFYYNELKEYIMSLPERFYSYYSLETIPAPELFKMFVDNLRQTASFFEAYE